MPIVTPINVNKTTICKLESEKPLLETAEVWVNHREMPLPGGQIIMVKGQRTLVTLF